MSKKYKSKTEKFFLFDTMIDGGKSNSNMQAKLNQLGSQGWKEISRNIENTRTYKLYTINFEKEINIKKPKNPKKSKPDYLKEITVLLDLLEDDTLSKDIFIKKMRQKLK